MGLTTLGAIHTGIGLAALVLGFVALAQEGRITTRSGVGRAYLLLTLATALTALGIFQRGGFGPPHALALMTLAALALGTAAARTGLLGRAAAHVELVAFSSTFLFHLIPGVTETSLRLPVGAPLAASESAPVLLAAYAVLLVLFAIGLTWQLRRLRAAWG